MRIESVTAHAFGPLAGQTLELAPGMTVVTGLNESGKSSWHAAFYSALCGRRRGPGADWPPIGHLPSVTGRGPGRAGECRRSWPLTMGVASS